MDKITAQSRPAPDGADEPIPTQVVGLIADEVVRRLRANTLAEYLTTDEAATYLRCRPQRVRELCSRGDIPRYKDGRRNLYRRRDLDRYVAKGLVLR